VVANPSDYTFKWSNGSLVQNISNLSRGVYTLTVTDSYSKIKKVNFQVESKVVWQYIAGATVDPSGRLIKNNANSAWDAGASSTN
jgi:hypothetical protein